MIASHSNWEQSTFRNAIVLGLVLVAVGCVTTSQSERPAQTHKSDHKLVLLTRDGCPATASMRRNLEGALKSLGTAMSTPTENPTVPPIENPTDRRGDEPQFVAAS